MNDFGNSKQIRSERSPFYGILVRRWPIPAVPARVLRCTFTLDTPLREATIAFGLAHHGDAPFIGEGVLVNLVPELGWKIPGWSQLIVVKFESEATCMNGKILCLGRFLTTFFAFF